MNNIYTDEQIKRAEGQIVEEFRLLCKYECAKLTVNMNRPKARIEIVPEPHIRIESEKNA